MNLLCEMSGVDRNQGRHLLERINQRGGNSLIPHSLDSLVWCSTQLLSCRGMPFSSRFMNILTEALLNTRLTCISKGGLLYMSDEEAYYFHFFPEAMNSCFLDPHSCLSPESGINLPCCSQASQICSSRFVPILHMGGQTGDCSICLGIGTPFQQLKQLAGRKNVIIVHQACQQLFHCFLHGQTRGHGTLFCT